jgi:hypothetical protein
MRRDRRDSDRRPPPPQEELRELTAGQRQPYSQAFGTQALLSCLILEEAAARPRLKLLPRSVQDPVNALAETLQKQSVFGGAKPREEVLAEQVKST